jgi:hypothetical protein
MISQKILDEPGDLSRQMRREQPNITSDQAIWCSNFQTDNQECDEPVREWLLKNFKSRFENY